MCSLINTDHHIFRRFNLHAHRITVDELANELDENPDRIDEVKSVQGVHDWTPLNFACHNWNWDAALHLLLRGADPNVTNSVRPFTTTSLVIVSN